MKEYPHIDTIWARDMTNKGRIVEGAFTAPEFAYLAENRWIGTEKVDGTNVRVMWDGFTLRFGGKTNNAQMSTFLLARLQDLFSPMAMLDKFGNADSGPQVCLYGEGFGATIQKGGGNYISDGVDFTLFDVKVGGWWLKRETIEEIATYFRIVPVPVVFTGTLAAACRMVRQGFNSQWGEFAAEGLVLKPAVDLLRRNGERLITKIKTVDYQ